MDDALLAETVDYVAIRRLQSAYADVVHPPGVGGVRRAVPARRGGGGRPPRRRAAALRRAARRSASSSATRSPGIDFFEFVVLNTASRSGSAAIPTSRPRACTCRSCATRRESGRFTVVYGVYHDRLARAGGHWWFEHRRYHTLTRSAADGPGDAGRVRVPAPPPPGAAVTRRPAPDLQEISSSPPSPRASRSGHSTHDHLTPRVPGRAWGCSRCSSASSRPASPSARG